MNIEQLFRSKQYDQISSEQLSKLFSDRGIQFFDSGFSRKFIYEILRDDNCTLDDIISACKLVDKYASVLALRQIHDQIIYQRFFPLKIEENGRNSTNIFSLIRFILESESISLQDLIAKCKIYSPNQTITIDMLYDIRQNLIESKEQTVIFHYENPDSKIPETEQKIESSIEGEKESEKRHIIQKKTREKNCITIIFGLFCFPCLLCSDT